MNPRKTLFSLLVFVVLIAACTNGETGGTSTTTAPTTTPTTDRATTSTSAPDPGTTVPVTDRVVEIVECDNASDNVAIVCEAHSLIMENYVDDIDNETLAEAATLALRTLNGADSDAALRCATPDDSFVEVCRVAANAADDTVEAAETMVAGFASYALDPNSAYLGPEALELLREEQQGEFQGIGALVSPEDQTIPGDNKQCNLVSDTCHILIVSTISGAPAEAAGLMRDDVLLEVNGESIIGWTINEVTSAVRGPEGTEVTLTLEREGEEYQVTITRAEVVIPVIESETIGDAGYVRLANFSGNAGSLFEQAIVDRLADGVDQLVIDLRNNPGGFLTTAIDVTSVFLETGDVVVTQGPDESTSYEVNGDAIVPEDMVVYLVVNKLSASASEVVAATLQERDRATVVGENTFGKNTVQQRFGLSNEGALKLTIARWLTPGGHDFGGTGVTPDIPIDAAGLTAEELVAAINNATT